MTDPRIQRLFDDPEWIRQVEESAVALEVAVRAAERGDEDALRSLGDPIDLDELRRKWLSG